VKEFKLKKLKWRIQAMLKASGFDLRRTPVGEKTEIEMFLAQCDKKNVSLIIDVGANIGQFAEKALWMAPHLKVLSIEPQRSAHKELIKKAAGNPNWIVAERCAIGRESGNTSINLAENSYSSSIYKITETHVEAADNSRTSGVEEVPLRTLPEALGSIPGISDNKIGLKIDTQGYELEVLEGSVNLINRIPVVLCELSLCPLYESAPNFRDMLSWFEMRGFRLVGLFPEFYHSIHPEMLQVNGIFVRDN